MNNRPATQAAAIGLLTLIGLATVATGQPPAEATHTENATRAEEIGESGTRVVPASELEWKHLNPKRGAAGPKAATLWGDQNDSVPSGFLAQFVDGFSSPPHLHNVTYRAVVIKGLVHNDDPDAAPLWMPTGSYWTQPAGQVHITSANGPSLVLVEIEKGPYLVLPPEQAFDRGEQPVNVVPANLVWLDAATTSWIDATPSGDSDASPQIAFLWGKRQDSISMARSSSCHPGFAVSCADSGRS